MKYNDCDDNVDDDWTDDDDAGEDHKPYPLSYRSLPHLCRRNAVEPPMIMGFRSLFGCLHTQNTQTQNTKYDGARFRCFRYRVELSRTAQPCGCRGCVRCVHVGGGRDADHEMGARYRGRRARRVVDEVHPRASSKRERERRVSVYEEAPGFRPGPCRLVQPLSIS